MKKILFAVLASTFATALMGDYVYDYKASIKRIEPSYKVRTVTIGNSKAKAVTSSYNVVSDTLSGYIRVPACKACDQGGVDSFTQANLKGTAYIVRKSDKYSAKAYQKDQSSNATTSVSMRVLKTNPIINSAIFGAYVDNTHANSQNPNYKKPLLSINDAKKAWMYLAYGSQNSTALVSSENVLKNITPTDLNYGFLGFDNIGIVEIEAAGFGTAKIMSTKDATKLGFCGDITTSGVSCQYINTISGTLVGYAQYSGPCNVTPMWDLCYKKDAQPVPVADHAVITGTWTLKYNKSLTTAIAAASDEPGKEKVILDKLNSNAIINGTDLKETIFND